MPSGGQNAIPEADLIQALRELAAQVGRSPSQKDINEHSPHSHKTYYRKFDGGLAEAKDRARLEMYEQQGRERVEVECANCGEDLERTPSEIEDAILNYCDNVCRYQHYSDRYAGKDNPVSTLEEVECQACGGTILRPKHKRERYDRFYCSDCFGDATVAVECEWCGVEKEVFPALEDSTRFCSLECHGEWISENNVGENHPRWNPEKEQIYYGPNWIPQRQKALERDGFECQECGVSQTEHVQWFGRELNVHHRTSLRAFRDGDDEIDYEAANRLKNLQTLCQTCHPKLENLESE